MGVALGMTEEGEEIKKGKRKEQRKKRVKM